MNLNALVSILALLDHENTGFLLSVIPIIGSRLFIDIVGSVLELLEELTQPDAFTEEPEAIVLVSKLVSFCLFLPFKFIKLN